MQKQNRKRVLAVLDDLFFTAKIMEAAKQAGIEVDFVKSEQDALAMARQQPLLIILDLNANSVRPLDLVTLLKADEATKAISVIGYLSHVQGELKQKAHETGCDMVMARSSFSTNLPQILRRHAAAA